LLPLLNPGLALLVALGAWLTVSILIWWLSKRHPR
jgi:peptidoglycan biosynthesis protein MviN/MurJ (putative lipid II flippase)